MPMFDWNDLKYLLALARHGSTLAAARALQVDQSTVQRRLAELERRIGQPLVQRQATGYRLSEFGSTLLPAAERIERAVQALEQQVTSERDALRGVLRITCPEPIVARLTQSGFIDRFHARHPGLQVEFVMSDRYLDLMRGDADIALRSGDTDDGELIGRKIGDSLWAVYAGLRYLERRAAPAGVDDLAGHEWIGFDDGAGAHRASEWLRRVAPGARVVARNHSVLGVLHSVQAGLGLAALPMAIAEPDAQLRRVLGPVDELTRIWRILASPAARHTPRVSAFFDFVVEEIPALRPIFTG